MQWVIINSKNALLQEYRLLEEDVVLVTVKYNPVHRSARVTAGNQHRLFFIESAGSLTGRHIFKNEYGIQVGSMTNDKLGKEGSVTIESKKYLYRLQNTAAANVAVYDTSDTLLASCTLHTVIKGSSLSAAQSIYNADCSHLLLGLCWLLYLPVAKETRVEYAA